MLLVTHKSVAYCFAGLELLIFPTDQDAKDFTRLRSIGLLEGWLGIEVILGTLDEGGDGSPFLVSEHTSQEGSMLLHLVLHGGCNSFKVAVWDLEERVVPSPISQTGTTN